MENNNIEIKVDTVITVSKNGKLEHIHFLDQNTHHVIGYKVEEMGFEDVEQSLKGLAGVSILGIDIAKGESYSQVKTLDNE